MEINKQLFEDVLTGKLKGTFVLRNGAMYSYKQLDRNDNWHAESCPYCIKCRVYRPNGMYGFTNIDSWDIVDFIPDIDMKENELTIEIPNGKIVDWEESKKQNKIVLKDKQLTYEDICDKLPGMIDIPLFDTPSEDGNALVANEHYLECILAKNKLATVAKYLNNGWKPDKCNDIYYINNYHGNLVIYLTKEECSTCLGQSIFKSQELAQQAIEILGEETIKLALEPLGI